MNVGKFYYNKSRGIFRRSVKSEVPSVEGVVTNSASSFISNLCGSQKFPVIKLKIDSIEGEFTLFNTTFRIDVGERVRLYCREGFRDTANDFFVFMDAIEFLRGDNDEVVFRAVLDKHDQDSAYFEEA
ncbi:MAG: hypothetical protein Q8N63_05090 [Nanoarchaeota archaeon]|nr:hypothetical protein [Nanoarchaeota archaeon]